MSTDFSSIDRLVEFGMGAALAQQMVNTMNNTMANMQTPGINTGVITDLTKSKAQGADAAERWFAVVENRQAGPLSLIEIDQLVKKNLIVEATLLWSSGMAGWQKACDIPEINKYLLLNKQ